MTPSDTNPVREAAPDPAALVLVPRQATEAMLQAAHHKIDWCRDDQNTFGLEHPSQTRLGVGTTCRKDLADAWAAMVEAAGIAQAPTAQEGEGRKHDYWRAGEPDCPKDIKAANGELWKLRCRRCGLDNPRTDSCRALRTPARPAPTDVETAAEYNARFDPANEAGQETFRNGFREGFLFATFPSGYDTEEADEAYRVVDGVALGEAWDAYRDQFFARLPLAALRTPARPAPTDVELAAAQIIDPWAFKQCAWAVEQDNDEVLRRYLPRRDEAIAKAQQIAALRGPAAQPAIQASEQS